MVSKSCSQALAPKKIHAAVKKVAEKTDRTRNIVYVVEEMEDETLETDVEKVLAEINEKPRVKDGCAKSVSLLTGNVAR